MGKTRKTPLLFSFSGPPSPPPPIPLENKSRYERILLSPFSYLLPSAAASASAAVGWRRLPSTTDEDEERTNVVRIRACDSEGEGERGLLPQSDRQESLPPPFHHRRRQRRIPPPPPARRRGRKTVASSSLSHERTKDNTTALPSPFPQLYPRPFLLSSKEGRRGFFALLSPHFCTELFLLFLLLFFLANTPPPPLSAPLEKEERQR